MKQQRKGNAFKNILSVLLGLACSCRIHACAAFQSTNGPKNHAQSAFPSIRQGEDLTFLPSYRTSKRHDCPIVRYQQADNSDNEEQKNGTSLFSILMVATPFLSTIFPLLVNTAKAFPEGSKEQFGAIVALFVSNRAYLYLMSTTIVALAASRGSKDDSRLGQRVVDLTEELLYNPPLEEKQSLSNLPQPETLLTQESKLESQYKRSAMLEQLSEQMEDSFDSVSGDTQAIILPLMVSSLLAASVFFVGISGQESTSLSSGAGEEIRHFLTMALPQISAVWNALILVLFSRCELRRLCLELEWKVDETQWLPWLLGGGITIMAYSGIWPAQNFINMALAGLVARAIQFPRLPPIVLALSLLTCYDAASVFLIKPAFASSLDDPLLTSAEPLSSAMGSVVMNKLSSSGFQPGLLVTKVKNSLGGALGLGDAVFPALLAIFSKRFDDAQGLFPDKSTSYLTLSLVAYAIGCITCEFAPFISTSGAPALLFICPAMLLGVLGTAVVRGDLKEMWQFESETE